MKTLAILLCASLASTLTWAQQAVGNSQVNIDFSKYKSFTWAQTDATTVGPEGYDIYYYEFEPVERTNKKMNKTKRVLKQEAQQEKQPAYIYSYSVIIPATNADANNVIKDAISNELEGRGYRETPDNGDLIVVYHVLEGPATLHGYNNDNPAEAGGSQVRQPSDTASFHVEPGTLLINLVDSKTSQTVWTGFSSGMIDNNTFVTDEVELKEAIHSIFEKFKYTADKAHKD
ncbi:MAG TPA: DUF4136 domain-containing protein [Cyclobacteriaceae bacterium]|nr:DUF4136 domain-containing protein [Cyclobacteriaceae bacterium]